MVAHHINLAPQIQDWLGPTATGADGTITATLMQGGMPTWSVVDENVVSPNAITMNIVNGHLNTNFHVDLPATTGAQYWKFTIQLGTVKRTWYFTWLDDAHTDFADLDFINPRTYTGA